MGRGLLTDKVALVTGAGQGLGQAVAREFAGEGAAVALPETNPTTAAEVEAELTAKGFQARAYPLDVTDYDAYAQAIAEIVARWRLARLPDGHG